MTTHVSFI